MTEPLVAVTGGTGFIGSHLVRLLHKQGWRIRILSRRLPLHPLLANSRFEVVIGDMGNQRSLHQLVKGCSLVIHAAGLVKAAKAEDFFRVNHQQTKTFAEIVQRECPQGRFIFISSLAAREKLSVYGLSKFCAEEDIKKLTGLQTTIIRPPAVYGEFDQEILPLIKLVNKGFGLILGSTKSRFSLIHVHDLARFIAHIANDPAAVHKSFEPDDGKKGGYLWIDIIHEISRILHKKHLSVLRIPAWLLKGYAVLATMMQGVKPASINILGHGKIREILHSDWICHFPEINWPKGWQPLIPLPDGLTRTITAYRQMGWL